MAYKMPYPRIMHGLYSRHFIPLSPYNFDDLKIPPSGGLSYLTPQYYAAFEKTNFVFEAMRHLPYFDRKDCKDPAALRTGIGRRNCLAFWVL
jgi:hypothetical protein